MRCALHNSRMLEFRKPFGAVHPNGNVQLSIRLSGALLDRCISVRLRLWVNGGERIVDGQRKDSCGCADFSFTAVMPDHTGLVWYYFIIDTLDGAIYYGGRTGEGALYSYPPDSYQITVYDQNYNTPEWFREGVMYQIFPDRFNRSADLGGIGRIGYHRALGRKAFVHCGWAEPPVYLPLPGEKDYDPCDFYGGDFDGIREKLPYLKDMGVTCIYLNPVFESPSNHRYNTADYMRADPVLGSEDDLKRLVYEAKGYGIRIMLDGVFSHTGDDSVYFDRYGRYGGIGAYLNCDSPYRKWYCFECYPDDYRCWWGFKTLPEINETEPSYMEFVSRVLTRWASIGLTSWRIDVADELPDSFIKMLRSAIKRNDPEGVLLGEVWEDASNKHSMGARREYVDGFELDSAMGYPFRSAVLDFLLGRIDAYGLNQRLGSLCENYPEPFLYAQMNLLGSHDTVRILSALGGAPDRDTLTREQQAKYSLTGEQTLLGKRRLILAAVLQASMPGVPCIYYGDEAGVAGMADPFNRTTFPWGNEDRELFSPIRDIMRLRAGSAALKRGWYAMAPLCPDAFAIIRSHGKDSIVAAVNRAGHEVKATVSPGMFAEGPHPGLTPSDGLYVDVLSGNHYSCHEGCIELALPPCSAALLKQGR